MDNINEPIYFLDFIMPDQIKDLVFFPDKRLMQPSQEVGQISKNEQKEFDELAKAVKHHQGLGLAGVQLGIMKKMFVVDHDYIVAKKQMNIEPLGKLLFMADVVILEQSKEMQINQEGCLSLPGVYPNIQRPNRIKVSYLDYNGERNEICAEGLLAACIQHENDHTVGKLILNYQSALHRRVLVKKIAKNVKEILGS